MASSYEKLRRDVERWQREAAASKARLDSALKAADVLVDGYVGACLKAQESGDWTEAQKLRAEIGIALFAALVEARIPPQMQVWLKDAKEAAALLVPGQVVTAPGGPFAKGEGDARDKTDG